MTVVAGLVLAAGAGRRMGQPKALLRHASGETFVHAAVQALRDGGCDSVTVVVGAAPVDAAEVDATIVTAPGWESGMGESLRAGLSALDASDAAVALVLLVDLPDVGSAVVQRVLAATPIDDNVLARATFGGEPGHPVLIGRAHWAAVRAAADGDKGARDYLAANEVKTVECGDLATGSDLDVPR